MKTIAVHRYIYKGALYFWLLFMILTCGIVYHIVYKESINKISEHFEKLIDLTT